MKNPFIAKAFTAFCAAFLLTAGTAHALVAADYDGDGKSDFEVVSVSKNQRTNTGTTTWFIRNSSNAQVQTYTFSIPLDALVRFYQPDGKFYPAGVWVQDAKKPLVWDVAGPGGHIRFTFGLPGDIIPNQVALFGGSTNPTVVRGLANGNLQWLIYDWRTGQVHSTIFGVVGDQVGIAPDGTFLALRNNFTWYGKTLFGTTLSFVRQWGLPGDIPMIPLNANQLVVVRQGASNTLAYVLNPDGSNYTQQLGPNGSIPNIGHFFNSTGLDFGWHERSLGRVTAFNSQNGGAVAFNFGNSSMAIVTPPGEVFQPGSDGRFGSNGGGGGGGGGGNPPPSSGSCGNLPIVNINSLRGVLWKAENLHGGRGASFLVQNRAEDPIPTQSNRGAPLVIKNARCADIAKVCLYAKDAPFGYGGRYYAGTCNGQGALSGPEIFRRAGGAPILVQGRGKWVQIFNSSRDGNIAK